MQIPARCQHVPDNLNAEDHRLLASLDVPREARWLTETLSISPPALRAGVRRLLWAGLLQGPRASQSRTPPPAPMPQTGPLTLNFTAGLSHQCQGCGGCCTASDIGPISARHVAALQAVDWAAEIPGLPHRSAGFQAVSYQGQTVYLTAKQQDTCVFLDDNTRCHIHRRLGAGAKPLPCRQFPWRFTRVGNRVDVSLYAECRSWQAATTAAPPPETLIPELNDIIGARPIPALHERLPVDATLWADTADYLAAEDGLIADIRSASGSWLAPLWSYNDGVQAMLRSLGGAVGRADAALLSRDAWSAAFPEVAWSPSERDARTGVLAALKDFAGQAEAMAASRELPWLALRFRFLGRAADAPAFVSPMAMHTPDPDALRKMLADLLVSAIFGKEPARMSLRAGFARLTLRVWLTVHMAALRAREACRVQLLPQDLNDSMVTLSKVFREPAVHHMLHQIEPQLLDGFSEGLPSHNTAVSAHG